MPVEPQTVELFIGADFKMEGQPRNLGELRAWIEEMKNEIEGWGDDDVELAECVIMRDCVIVTLKEGIPQ